MIARNNNNNIEPKFRHCQRRALLNPARKVVPIVLLVLSFLFLSLVSSSSVPSKRRRRNSNNKSSNNSNGKLFHSTVDFSIDSSSSSSGCCDGNPVLPTHKRACGVYIWDFPSALLYKWCHHLLKDRVYEGKGGHFFVRYESNSILKLLYPCSRHSPNRCMLCGGSYEDHLELWWSKHLYSPFDQYLDKTYNDALTIKEEEHSAMRQRSRNRHSSSSSHNNNNNNKKQRNQTRQNNSNRRSSIKKSSSALPFQIISDPPSFCYHKRYVEDVSEIVRGIANPREKRMAIKEQHPTKSNHIMVPCQDVTYIAPHVGGYASNVNKLENYTKKDAMIDIFAIMLYSRIDAMIGLQQWEFRRKKLRNSLARNRI